LQAALSLNIVADGVLAGTTLGEFSSNTQLSISCSPSSEAQIEWQREGEDLPRGAYQTGNSLV